MADGKIIAISISEKKGQKKHNIESANLIVDHGMEGDAHAGNWHRQISLLGIASIEHMRAQGADVKPGDFAENITVEGMVLYELAVGTHLQVGDDVILEMTADCGTITDIFELPEIAEKFCNEKEWEYMEMCMSNRVAGVILCSGTVGVELLVRSGNGELVPNRTTLPVSLVVRETT